MYPGGEVAAPLGKAGSESKAAETESTAMEASAGSDPVEPAPVDATEEAPATAADTGSCLLFG